MKIRYASCLNLATFVAALALVGCFGKNGGSADAEIKAPGKTSLSWTAPTEKEDDTALPDLAGYTIYYGRSPGKYLNGIRIDDPDATSYLVDNLTPGTYYFVVAAFDSSGNESRLSGEAIRVIE